MASRTRPVSRLHRDASMARLAAVSLAAGDTARGKVSATVGGRGPRPRLAMVGVPLAMSAALIAEQPWAMLPLALCAWWWAPHAWGWEWLVALGRGVVGAEWAVAGATALAAFPDARLVVAAAWAGMPAAFAIYAAMPAWRPQP
jgi:hypothetical protein